LTRNTPIHGRSGFRPLFVRTDVLHDHRNRDVATRTGLSRSLRIRVPQKPLLASPLGASLLLE
jgi:hypothetical protein